MTRRAVQHTVLSYMEEYGCIDVFRGGMSTYRPWIIDVHFPGPYTPAVDWNKDIEIRGQFRLKCFEKLEHVIQIVVFE